MHTNQHLEHLVLWGNTIGDAGAKALGEALRTNSTITELNLKENVIGDKGASALARALRDDNRSLRVLDLRSNLIANKGMQDIEKMIQINRGVRQLLISDNMYAGDEEHLHKRITRVMDLNEIGYWRIVEEEMRVEREKAIAEAEAAAAGSTP